MTADVSAEVNALIRAGKRLLFEGAQAALLDIDHGTYPFVTSSNCVAGQASAGAGVGPQQLHYVLGVAKAYATRVGSGPFPTELDDEVGERLRVRGNEYGSVTGRPRRCGWFDAAGLRRVVDINGITGLCITKLDVLDGLDTVRIAVGYKVRGERRDILPVGAEALSICAPIYEELPGWQESTEGVKSFDDLPKNAQAYLRRLEVLVGAPIAIISTGPDRRDDHPAPPVRLTCRAKARPTVGLDPQCRSGFSPTLSLPRQRQAIADGQQAQVDALVTVQLGVERAQRDGIRLAGIGIGNRT